MPTGSTISLDVVAKSLNMGFGRNKLFRLLRDKGILQRNNIPYQKYMELGYFVLIEQKYEVPSGRGKKFQKTSFKTTVTEKGLEFVKNIIEGSNPEQGRIKYEC